MKYIYLDSRFWIDIGDNLLVNKDKNVEYFYYMLKELVDSKKAICPISNPIFLELFKQTDKRQRKMIAKVMDELSCGVMMESKYYLFQKEIRRVIGKQESIWVNIKDIRNLYEERIIDTKILRNNDSNHRLPTIQDVIDVIQVGGWSKFNDQVIEINKYLQEQKLNHESEITNFKQLQSIEILNTLQSICDIFPEIKEEINQLSTLPNLSDIYTKFPSIWAFGSIHALLRYDRGKIYKINDYFDIDHCTMAIGYYDYLFTERTFYHIVTNSLANLDNLFKVKCCKNYEEGNLLLHDMIMN